MDQPHRHTARCFDDLVDGPFFFSARKLRETGDLRDAASRAIANRYGIPWERYDAPADPEDKAFLDALTSLSTRLPPRPPVKLHREGLAGEDLARYEARLTAFVPILRDVLELHREKQTAMTI